MKRFCIQVHSIVESKAEPEVEVNIDEDVATERLPFFCPQGYFGEQELFDISNPEKNSRRYTAVAYKDTTLLKISYKVFLKILEEEKVLYPFLKSMDLRENQLLKAEDETR